MHHIETVMIGSSPTTAEVLRAALGLSSMRPANCPIVRLPLPHDIEAGYAGDVRVVRAWNIADGHWHVRLDVAWEDGK